MKLTHNPYDHEVHFDRYDIDYMRYYTLNRFFLSVIGSLIGFSVWFLIPGFRELAYVTPHFLLYLFYTFAGSIFIMATASIIYFAGNTHFESLRLALRRALFSFTVILIITLVGLSISSLTSWDQPFGEFIKLLLFAMIPTGIVCVLCDYVAPAINTYMHGKAK
ncbi:MAG: hypothetical protein ACMXYE_03075 [Candidatus Woesearchaeota archaeon]